MYTIHASDWCLSRQRITHLQLLCIDHGDNDDDDDDEEDDNDDDVDKGVSVACPGKPGRAFIHAFPSFSTPAYLHTCTQHTSYLHTCTQHSYTQAHQHSFRQPAKKSRILIYSYYNFYSSVFGTAYQAAPGKNSLESRFILKTTIYAKIYEIQTLKITF